MMPPAWACARIQAVFMILMQLPQTCRASNKAARLVPAWLPLYLTSIWPVFDDRTIGLLLKRQLDKEKDHNERSSTQLLRSQCAQLFERTCTGPAMTAVGRTLRQSGNAPFSSPVRVISCGQTPAVQSVMSRPRPRRTGACPIVEQNDCRKYR